MEDEQISEMLYPNWGQHFIGTELLAGVRSDFQEIRVLETVSHGRVLMLDGVVQITEADEFVYQEMLAHVPLILHGDARRVLIIGAGDGGVLRRVLMHRQVERAVMVEIDGEVIRLSKQFLPSIAGDAWADCRAEIIIGDGIEYVGKAPDCSFDVLIVDSTDPVGVGEVLFTDAFYRECARVLGPCGIIVNQCGVPFMQSDELRETSERRARHFRSVTAYVAAVPTYVGGFMTLGIATNDVSWIGIDETVAEERAKAAGIIGRTSYWSPAIQRACFVLPPYISKHLPRS